MDVPTLSSFLRPILTVFFSQTGETCGINLWLRYKEEILMDLTKFKICVHKINNSFVITVVFNEKKEKYRKKGFLPD